MTVASGLKEGPSGITAHDVESAVGTEGADDSTGSVSRGAADADGKAEGALAIVPRPTKLAPSIFTPVASALLSRPASGAGGAVVGAEIEDVAESADCLRGAGSSEGGSSFCRTHRAIRKQQMRYSALLKRSSPSRSDNAHILRRTSIGKPERLRPAADFSRVSTPPAAYDSSSNSLLNLRIWASLSAHADSAFAPSPSPLPMQAARADEASSGGRMPGGGSLSFTHLAMRKQQMRYSVKQRRSFPSRSESIQIFIRVSTGKPESERPAADFSSSATPPALAASSWNKLVNLAICPASRAHDIVGCCRQVFPAVKEGRA